MVLDGALRAEAGDRVNVGDLVRLNVVRGAQWGVAVEATNRRTRVLDDVLFDQTVAHVRDVGTATIIEGNVCWLGSC